ncbi:uncharacterized protein A4U43_C05F20300 [Asparagus officinalis]|uniref:Uncharacterized protein n=1 Tax=Asparagus officinalis TaxID=4686 RepID=A0A5P1EXF3_ASPOF|nr:uncharacterized protein A4U43_C05F20300 [Asparagus officinalis]
MEENRINSSSILRIDSYSSQNVELKGRDQRVAHRWSLDRDFAIILFIFSSFFLSSKDARFSSPMENNGFNSGWMMKARLSPPMTSEMKVEVDRVRAQIFREDTSASVSAARPLHLRNYHPNHAAKRVEKRATRTKDAGLHEHKDYEFLQDSYCPINLPVIYRGIKTKMQERVRSNQNQVKTECYELWLKTPEEKRRALFKEKVFEGIAEKWWDDLCKFYSSKSKQAEAKQNKVNRESKK